jgi:hypothetical protein
MKRLTEEKLACDIDVLSAERAPMKHQISKLLLLIFFNNEDNVRLFLEEIAGMQPNDITDLVNQWVKEKRISDYGSSRKGDLWKILHEAELYPRTIQNWNRRVQ